MREIEFRGRCNLVNGFMWNYGRLNTANTKPSIIGYQGSETLVEPETVGEWTGLYDKHFRRIYEGDVLKFSWDSPCGLIEFLGMVKFRAKDAAFRVWCDDLEDWSGFSGVPRIDIEVIGNVFDDPELDKQFGEVYRSKE